MNVGWLRWVLRDVDPSCEVMLKIDVGQLKESGAIYADATNVDFVDVVKHNVVYIEADEY